MDARPGPRLADTPKTVHRKRRRYRQVSVPRRHSDTGAYREPEWLPVWHVDGVPWHQAPKPWRWHLHRAHTVGVHQREEVWRCRCGAYGAPGKRWRIEHALRVAAVSLWTRRRKGQA